VTVTVQSAAEAAGTAASPIVTSTLLAITVAIRSLPLFNTVWLSPPAVGATPS
jgi:hypothetical protein